MNCSARKPPGPGNQRGFALVLTMIFAVMLYILVAELVVRGRMLRHTGENEALLARIHNQMQYKETDIEQSLLDDLAGAAAQGGDGGGSGLGQALGGAPGGSAGGQGSKAAGADGGAGGAGESDPSASCDSSRDAWFKPQAFADGDLTTYVWVEDENRKFNILSLWSPDAEFAKASRDRLVRLLDKLREDSEFDLSMTDAEHIVSELEDWAKRNGTDALPRPKLKTDDDHGRIRETSVPLQLDELLLLQSVNEDLFYDKVFDGKVYLGLESVLTGWTSLALDPGDPDKVARQQAKAPASGAPGSGAPASGAAPGSGPASSASAPGARAGGNPAASAGNQSNPNDPNAPPPQPEGQGIKININTASRPVLRSLMTADQIPDDVIEAILRYRNTIDDKDQDQSQNAVSKTNTADFGDLRLGEDAKYKFFAEVGDLEQVPEFANLPNPDTKAEFQRLLTTHSDVFSIHMASLFKRNEEKRVFVMQRARSIVYRRDDGGTGQLVPLVLQEERHGLRVQPIDFQEEFVDRGAVYSEMDSFAQDEHAWNPFLVDFYLSKSQREQFYRPRR